jgi:phosphoglycolate phosphatase
MVTLECNGVRFENVSAIVFDKDGTLADSIGFLKELGQNRAQAVAAEVSGIETAILQAFGYVENSLNPAGLLAVGTRLENEIAVATLIAQTGRDWIEALEIARFSFKYADRDLARKADLTPPFDGIIPLVRSLHAQDVKLAILSSDSQTNVQDFVDRYTLTSYFQVLMGAQKGLSKPDPQLLEWACAALNTHPPTTLVIGDTIADLQLAIQGGAIGSIGVTWGGTTPVQLAKANAIADKPEQIQIL